jgi:hypothetical protein
MSSRRLAAPKTREPLTNSLSWVNRNEFEQLPQKNPSQISNKCCNAGARTPPTNVTTQLLPTKWPGRKQQNPPSKSTTSAEASSVRNREIDKVLPRRGNFCDSNSINSKKTIDTLRLARQADGAFLGGNRRRVRGIAARVRRPRSFEPAAPNLSRTCRDRN